MSDGRNVRPTIGVTPNTSKNRAVTDCAGTCSGVPSGPAIVGSVQLIAAIDANV